MNKEKNERIREKRRKTKEKRKNQSVKVFKIKFDKSKISRQKMSNLKRLFLEGKWFTNYVISQGITNLVSHRDYKIKKVKVKVGDKFEERELNLLSSQMKEYIITRLKSNVNTLAKLRKEGKKVGKIKYIKALHSIFLQQYGNTYKLDKKAKLLHLQGIGDFKVIGLEQIPDNCDITTANLIERNGDYYLHVTVYLPKEEKVQNKRAIGIDLGVKNQITFSNGIKLKYSVEMPEKLRKLYKDLSRAKYNKETKQFSKRGEKILVKIRKEFMHQNNQKKDIINKITHYLSKNYEFVAYQNDSLQEWQKLFGRKIYQTSVGGFRDTLKRKVSTPLEVGRFTKTTGVCIYCGHSMHLNLSERLLICPSCGHVLDRDVSAANVILKEGLSLWNVGETLAEDYASTSSMLEYLNSIPHVKASMSNEARSPKQADGAQIEAPSVRVG
jgi:putative transposase